MYTLKIKVTKDTLFESRFCGMASENNIVATCAIALEVRKIFPDAQVSAVIEVSRNSPNTEYIWLPQSAIDFIYAFDRATPYERITMPEFEFKVSIPDAVIKRINIDEIKSILLTSPTLTLTEK